MEESTLLFRHLPTDLSQEERRDLLHHLGATKVQVMGRSGSMKNSAFAVFPNKDEATKILKQLHQVEFLGSKLRVEFAHKGASRVASVVDNEGVEGKDSAGQEPGKTDAEADPAPEQKEIKFDETFAAWGLKHSRRPDLCYLYPPPTPSTLTNIVHALAAVPKFYVQVLHLMNKMDLPAPFGAVTSAPPVHSDAKAYLVTDNVDQPREMDISSEAESELESDEGERDQRRAKDKELPARRPSGPGDHRRERRPRKRPRLSDLWDSVVLSADASLSQAGDSAALPMSQVFDQQALPADHQHHHAAAAGGGGAGSRRIELRLPSAILPDGRSDMERLPAPPLPPPIPPPHTRIVQDMPQPPLPPLPADMSPALERQSGTFRQTSESSHRAGDPTHQPGSSVWSVHHSALPGTERALRQDVYNVPLPPPQQAVSSEQFGEAQRDWQRQTHTEPGFSEEHGRDDGGGDGARGDAGGFGVLQPQPRTRESSGSDDETAEKEWSKSKFISSSELRRARLSHSEMKDYSVFRRYNEGEPSCRLYIKNLAKQVEEEDIHWIFGRYVDWDSETEKNIFDIRLMREGRMKGQAFVTLPTEHAAKSALKDTNGFLLKEKPMVVQFARSAKAQEDSASKP